MPETYIGLSDEKLMQLALGLRERPRPRELHDYIETVRNFVDGKDTIVIPQSHRNLRISANHEGGLRLNYRIRQGAAWWAQAQISFNITPGSSEFRDQAEQMEKFARFGERRLMRGKSLHRWKRETARDLFECGISVIQRHPTRDFYVRAQSDRTLMSRGPRIEEVIFTRRIDPLHWFWDEDSDGAFGASLLEGAREYTELATLADSERIDALRSFKFAESLPDDRFVAQGPSVRTAEIQLPDGGALIIMETDEQLVGNVAIDDPGRIIARWSNPIVKVPVYATTATPWPWISPLDEMVQLTAERNFWATMMNYQASGAIFRHWQLTEEGTGNVLGQELWANQVPENVLLDLSEPPPFMGPGTKWELAPFEFHDVVPRLQMITQQHEEAGLSIARLMGNTVNQNTAVGTADMIDEFAETEFGDLREAAQDMTAEMWEDTFAYIRKFQTREPVVVAARRRDEESKFYNTHLELRGSDIVAEDVSCTYDMSSLLRKIALYRVGREMQNNGDIGYDRRVEAGLVPFVDDADEEKSAIYVDTLENITLEQEAIAHMQATAENLGLTSAEPSPQPAPPNITRGVRTDPRSAGVGRGALNTADSALAPGATDIARSA